MAVSRKTLALLRGRERAVIQCANRAAEAAGHRLSDYKRPKAMCYSSPGRSLWSVQYSPRLKEASRRACFWVAVDLEAGTTKFVACSS
jgi:hypothetical protein